MPKQVLPESEVAAELQKWFDRMGFVEVTADDLRRRFPERSRVRGARRTRRPWSGRELGYLYSANGYHALVWTTLTGEGPREEDAAWALILDEKGVPRYFSRPIHRTARFLERLVNHAWIAKFRVSHRPVCGECSRSMDIVRGRGLKSRYWKCLNPAHGAKAPAADFDEGLPPRARAFLKAERKRRRKYREARAKDGKENFMALLRRARSKKSS